MKRIAVVGAGWMARVRTRALLASGQVVICGVAACHMASAQKFGAEIGCTNCCDDYTQLAAARPDAILVEVPHEAQDRIVLWALEQGLHILIGGSLATSTAVARRIAQVAREKHLVVEAGYEARYSAPWVCAKELIDTGVIGRLITIRSIALWAGNPGSWYYNQHISGGMPLTHMTYCFINPVRWIAGDALAISAFTSRVANTAPELVAEENCVANMLFGSDVLCSMTAGFVAPGGLPAWSTTFIGTNGALEVRPDEGGSGSLTVYSGTAPELRQFDKESNAFEVQARVFLTALDGAGGCRNTPQDTIGDIRVAEAIVTSARERRTITL